MNPEDLAHPGLGHRLTSSRASQHHETCRGGETGGPFVTKVRGEFGEERCVDRHDPFTPAFAHHPDPVQPHVHIGEPQRTDLGGT